MKKTVKFKDTTGQELWIEFLPYCEDFLKNEPEIHKNPIDGNARLLDIANSYSLFREGEEKPFWVNRRNNPDSTRWVGICELGDGPLSVQAGGEMDTLAGPDTPMHAYRKISDNPVCYGFGADDPFCEYRFYEDHATFNEGNLLIGEADYFPFAIIEHQSVWRNVSPIFHHGIFKGTYKGEPVTGIARINRGYMPQRYEHKVDYRGYIDICNAGVREDGRKELAFIHYDYTGKVCAIYWLEGEEIIVSNEFEMEAEWVRLPYMKDGTCVYKDAIFRFCGKEIHFEGKWGAKGFTPYPRIEDKPGQSQVFGTWYEGSVPYRHSVYCSFHENQEAYDYNIEKLGFDVVDEKDAL